MTMAVAVAAWIVTVQTVYCVIGVRVGARAGGCIVE